MLLQRAGTGTIPPPDFSPPHWESLAAQWQTAPKPVVATVEIGASIVTIGIDDIEAEDTDPAKCFDIAGHIFGWDNESPSRQVEVKAFRIEWRPVTNGEFYEFSKGAGQGRVKFPASWEDHNGETCVSRTHPSFRVQSQHTIGADTIWSSSHKDRLGLASPYMLRESFSVCECQRRTHPD